MWTSRWRRRTSRWKVSKKNYDVVIRGGPDTFYGYSMRPFLSEERLPVCSPALLQRLPLRMPDDLRRHTLLHTSSLPRLWPDWLAKAQIPALKPAATLTFDHFYLTLQAAIDGNGHRDGTDRAGLRRSRGRPACHAIRRSSSAVAKLLHLRSGWEVCG